MKLRAEMVLTILGIVGLSMIVSAVIRIAIWKKVLINNGMITDTVGYIFNGVCMLTMSMVYWIKQYLNKKSYKED